jgi:hypothetical protein
MPFVAFNTFVQFNLILATKRLSQYKDSRLSNRKQKKPITVCCAGFLRAMQWPLAGPGPAVLGLRIIKKVSSLKHS